MKFLINKRITQKLALLATAMGAGVAAIIIGFAVVLFSDSRTAERIAAAEVFSGQLDRERILDLEMRRNEKDFFARRELQYEKLFDDHFAGFNENIGAMKQTALLSPEDVALITRLQGTTGEYQKLVKTAMSQQEREGLTEDQGLQGEFREAVHEVEQQVNDAKALRLLAGMLTLRRHEKDFLLRGRDEYLEQHRTAMDEFYSELAAARLDAATTQSIRGSIAKYADKFAALVASTKERGRLETLWRAKYREVEPLETQLSARKNQLVAAEQRTAFVTRTAVMGAVALLLVLVAALVYAILANIRASLGASLGSLLGAIKRLAGGDASARSQVKSGDEMQELSSSFDRLLDERVAVALRAEQENEQLNNSVIGVLQSVSNLSKRDLTVRVPVTQDVIGTVADSINQLAEETGRVLGQVTRIAGTVGDASQQVRARAEAVNKTASDERQSVARMLKQLEGAVQTQASVNELAGVSNRTAGEVSKATETALSTVQNTVRGMDTIRESIGEMEKRIKRLAERSQEIGQIVSLITTISERTHVLSLNASMQAATAGEAGKGFAVVAEQVQRLADNSQQATLQIANLVQNIQIETADTINSVNRAIDQVVRGSEMANQSGQQMRETREATSRLVELVERISASTQEQARITESLRQGAQAIDASTRETAQQLTHQAKVTESLVGASRSLVESVSVFKLTEAA